ncbi:MAG: ABC transporter substrate-binding protein, partial [Patescibacteria group bacterium]
RLASLNLKPLGCGPFAFASLKREASGVVKSITLAANDRYYQGRPYLDTVTFKFYPDFGSLAQAAENKNISAVSYLPLEAQTQAKVSPNQGWRLWPLSLPQYTAIFFNQEASGALKDLKVRTALAQAIDRSAMIEQALAGQAELADSPILAGMIGYTDDHSVWNYDLPAVTALLDGAGWKAMTPNEFITWSRQQEQKAATDEQPFVDQSDEERLAALGGQEYFRMKSNQPLTVNLTVVNQSESAAVGQFIQRAWQAVGVQTIITTVAPEQIRREVIKPRRYGALLYSEIVGADPDPYAFWHSSQAVDPGLNLARYSNRKVDKLIDEARATTDPAVRQAKYQELATLLTADVPAVFLYRPLYPYWVSDRIKGVTADQVAVPADRLLDLPQRYIATKRGWRSAP